MLYDIAAPPDAKQCPFSTKYQLFEPVQVRIRRKSGEIELVGYGIGEIIEVMEPRMQYCIPPHRRLKEIPMSDGSFIVEFPENINYKRYHE